MISNSNVLVIGSINMDFVINCKRLPKPGETCFGKQFSRHPGGKGANQAVAACQLGAPTKFIGARGDDEEGNKLLKHLKSTGLSTSFKISKKATGTAHIFVTENGENHIVVISGANNDFNPDDLNHISEELIKSKVLLLQLEIPLETVKNAAKLASQSGVIVILDPAPARELPDDLLRYVDFIIPNQNELKQLTKSTTGEESSQAKFLLSKGVKNVLITKGKKGVTLYNNDEKQNFKAPKVEVIDTTAAGDAFAGALATGISKGLTLKNSIRLGIYYSSVSVTMVGAQSSMLNKTDFWKQRPESKELFE